MKRSAVFLDRDGVLVEEIFNKATGQPEAPLRVEDVRLLSDTVVAALRELKRAGYALIVVSNQAGFAKGKTTLRQLRLVHERFIALLDAERLQLDKVYYAYAHPNGITPYFSGSAIDRKPNPYYLFVAAAEFDLELNQCWLVGDQESDVACALAAGVRPILIRSYRPAPLLFENVTQVGDLESAAHHILQCAEDTIR